MTTLSTRIVARFVIATLMIASQLAVGAASADAQPLRPAPSAQAPNWLPAARCSRPIDQESARIERLAELARTSRASAERNPLLLADVGYYEAELADSRRCTQSAAVR